MPLMLLWGDRPLFRRHNRPARLTKAMVRRMWMVAQMYWRAGTLLSPQPRSPDAGRIR
jgi:hypothetical protein